MAKRKFKPGDLVSFRESKWLPESGVVTAFAYYSPLARAHASGKRTPCWDVLCNNGQKYIVAEGEMRLEQRNETIV